MGAVVLPPVQELLENAVVVRLPMRTRFRGITAREVLIFRGPAGWGEFGPFVEYDDEESAAWLAAGIEAAWWGPPAARRSRVPVNATVPAVPAAEVAAILARNPGATTAKVKVAEPGQTLDDDVARVAATRELIPRVRVDANGKWSVTQAITALKAIGELEYAEQPCATVEELAQVRRAVSVPIAADESIRKAADPMRVIAADAADVAVLKVAPLGGMRAVLALADEIGLPVVISSALDSMVGMAAGVAAAAALPRLDLACGLGTGSLFVADVAPSFAPEDGALVPRWPGADALPVPVGAGMLADAGRTRWWRDRLTRCHQVLERRMRHGDPRYDGVDLG
ncbi:o-succinylbenzoate synthase [Gordonia sp. NB41Y]|uniref:o-succinylbenzoate synthase n=1 Tax=Gordonia sp. NB41Y TaxID=875808 RepID=UPI0006B185B0|nr:o-succinylbenzoate synthase [Gordonia sp. NB41Y]EMP11628.2 O-succinylbenzoate synthase [Gordonia sp. NB41Y]WLP89640.1 o-succinylbenzoate synthase [Gordonia sp. NB41Y]